MKHLAPLLLLLAVGCPRPAPPPPRALPVPDSGGPPRAHIDVEGADGRAYGLTVELALDDAQRERGLMFRKSLADGAGMLFVFPDASQRRFWMKNTLIPLDMIFADPDGLVLGCVQNAEPLTLTDRTVPGDAKYVLEVPGGWCQGHGIGPGSHVIAGEAARFPAR